MWLMWLYACIYTCTYYLAILPSNVNFLFRAGQYFPILSSYISQSILTIKFQSAVRARVLLATGEW